MTTPDLPTFLTQRYDEQEAVARAATQRGGWVAGFTPRHIASRQDDVLGEMRSEHDVTHIATHDPAYVLADLAAKRQIVESMGGDWVTRTLAQPFADHPDFRPEWKL